MAPATQSKPGSKRVDLILGQVDALPTLPSVATRLLQVSSAEDADFREIVSMIESDPALTAKILGLCRKADKRRAEDITTVDRAVVYLGFESVRAAALSVSAYELLASKAPQPTAPKVPGDDAPPLDRRQFWRYSIAVACAAEALVEEHGPDPGLPKPASAFVCGLLHGVGIIALENALPRAYARALHIASRTGEDLASVERALLGVDHHNAGRRLAEKWDLPPMLREVMWLTGLPSDALPDLPNKRIVGLINAAVGVTREQHLGWSGDPAHLGAETLCAACGIKPEAVAAVRDRLHAEVSSRATLLGINEADPGRLLADSIAQANTELSRHREAGARASSQARRCERALSTAINFRAAWAPGMDEACAIIAKAAGDWFGATLVALAHRSAAGEPWSIRRFVRAGKTARPLEQILADDAAPWEPQSDVADAPRRGSPEEIAAALDWAPVVLKVHDLPHMRGLGALLHDGADSVAMRPSPTLDLTLATWAAALVSAGRAEELRQLKSDTDSAGAEALSLRERVVLLEGAAHKIDFAKLTAAETARPLTLLRARAEVLQQTLTQQRDLRNVDAITSAATRLEVLMAAMCLTIDPPTPINASTDLAPLLGRAIREAMKRVGSNPKRASQPRIRLLVDEASKTAALDGTRLANAVTELVANCLEVPEVSLIEVDAHNEAETGRLIISVKDDGVGMPPESVPKALEPYALTKKNTQRKGLGLVMADLLMKVVGGSVAVANNANGKGLTATITVDRPAEPAGETVGGQAGQGSEPRRAA